MTLAELAADLTTALQVTCYYGDWPDEDATSLALRDFRNGVPAHQFGDPLPVTSPFGIAVHARAMSQDDARSMCLDAYERLLTLGLTATSPPVGVGRDKNGRYEVVATVQHLL